MAEPDEDLREDARRPADPPYLPWRETLSLVREQPWPVLALALAGLAAAWSLGTALRVDLSYTLALVAGGMLASASQLRRMRFALSPQRTVWVWVAASAIVGLLLSAIYFLVDEAIQSAESEAMPTGLLSPLLWLVYLTMGTGLSAVLGTGFAMAAMGESTAPGAVMARLSTTFVPIVSRLFVQAFVAIVAGVTIFLLDAALTGGSATSLLLVGPFDVLIAAAGGVTVAQVVAPGALDTSVFD